MQFLPGSGNCQQLGRENQRVSPLKPLGASGTMTNCAISELDEDQKRSHMTTVQLWREFSTAEVRPDFLIMIISGIEAAQSRLIIMRIGW